MKHNTQQTKKLQTLITNHVAEYRSAAVGIKETLQPKAVRAYTTKIHRAAGALDVLFQIDPKNPAWRETKWTA